MNVVIVGGGEIGTLIAAELHEEHGVTIIDVEQDREQAFEALDVRFLRGSGTDPDDLKAAGVEHADAFIACTSNDDVNVLSCLAGEGLGAGEALALVTSARYRDAVRHKG